MISASILKSLAIGSTVIVLGGTAGVGIFRAGERVGHYRAAKAVSDVVSGEQEPEALEQQALLPEELQQQDFSARGLIVASGSGEMTIETKAGKLRTVVLTKKTHVRSGGAPVESASLQVGDTIFILGQPEQQEKAERKAQKIIRATLIRVVSRGRQE